LKRAHNPKVVGSNPTPATICDEGLADVEAANPFRLPRLHPGIGSWACAAPVRVASARLGVSGRLAMTRRRAAPATRWLRWDETRRAQTARGAPGIDARSQGSEHESGWSWR